MASLLSLESKKMFKKNSIELIVHSVIEGKNSYFKLL